jgi:hypothetical protein
MAATRQGGRHPSCQTIGTAGAYLAIAVAAAVSAIHG